MPKPTTTSLARVESGELARPTRRDLSKNPAAVYLAGLSAGSRPTQGSALRNLAEMIRPGTDVLDIPWHLVEYQHVQGIRAKLVDRFAPTTGNRHLTALRMVLKEAWRLKQMSAEDYQLAVDVKPIRGSTITAGRALSETEIRKIFSAAAGESADIGARDGAIFGVLYAGGLRRREITLLDLDAYDAAAGSLLVQGKGNKQRVSFLPKTAHKSIARWLRVRGSAPGPMFVRFNSRRQPIPEARLSVSGVALIVTRVRELAKVAGFTTHDLRRTYISDAIDRTGDLSAIAGQVGHASVTTTARYDRRGERAKQKVAAGITFPDDGD